MKEETCKTRDYSLDWIRLFSCICVICIHVSNVYSRDYGKIDNVSYVFSVITNTVTRVSVPLFFMISGVLLIPQKVNAQKYKKRVLKYSAILLVWSIFYRLFNHFYMGPDYEGYEFAMENIFYQPVEKHLWFLFALLTVYLILPAIQTLCQKVSDRLMQKLLAVWLLGMFAITLLNMHEMKIRYPIVGLGSTYYIGYFIAGYFIYKILDKHTIPFRYILPCIIVGFVITAGYTLWDTNRSHIHVEDYFHYRSAFIAMSSIGIFIICLKKLKALPMNHFFQIATNCSFGIYLSHVGILNIIQKETSFFHGSSPIMIPVITLLIFISSYALVYGLKKLPGIRLVVS